jgi:2-C-methyl-D-erythritol 4-phosphate cytidylyltransferase
MVEWSIAAFRAAGRVGSIVVACPPGHAHGLSGHDLDVVPGGATRAESVANALQAVETELVAVHDAARPLVTPELIEGVVATLVADPEADGAIAATPITDTVKQLEVAGGGAEVISRTTSRRLTTSTPYRGVNSSSVVESTLDRSRLWAAQTPQVFRVEALRRALAAAPDVIAAATDEAMLVEAAGGRVLIHPSPPENLKVTTPLDLRVADLLLPQVPAN